MEQSFYYNIGDIHEKVLEKTSLIANNRRVEGVLPDNIIFHRQHVTIFKDLFDSAASDIFDALSGYSKSISDQPSNEDESYYNSSWFVEMDMPKDFNTKQLKYIDNEIKNALVNNIISRWFIITMPTESEVYDTLYNNNLRNIRFKLTNRVKPIIRPFDRFP